METKSLSFILPAIKVSQREEKGQAIYFSKIKAEDLSIRGKERYEIAYFERKDRKDIGYQRRLLNSSVVAIKTFILQESSNPMLPTALLVNSRNPLDFKEKGPFGIGELKVNETLYIIDGQHRFEAWKSLMEDETLRKQWGDFELPMVILSGFKEQKEIEQFYIINSRQKRIKTDLAQRFLLTFAKQPDTARLVSPSDTWKTHAVVIVDALNEQIENIWKEKIIIEGDSDDLRKAKIIMQNSFVMSLKPFFVGPKPFFNIPEESKSEDCAQFLAECWEVVGKIYPMAIKNRRDYSLMKTVGVFSIHLLINHLVKSNNWSLKDKKDIVFRLQNVLLAATAESTGNYPSDFWRADVSKNKKDSGRYAGSYSSGAGHSRLAIGLLTNQRM